MKTYRRNTSWNSMKNSEIEKWIDENCHSLKYRKILRLKMIDNHTYKDIAQEVDLTDRQVKNIVYKYNNMLIEQSE